MIDLHALNANAAFAAANPPAPREMVRLDTVAAPNFAPTAWQTTMALPSGAWKPPVPMSADLERVLALPRRDPPEGIITPATEERDEIRTPLGDAYVSYINSKLRKQPGPCRCSAIIAKYNLRPRPCLSSVRFVQAWTLCEIELVGGVLGQIGVGHGKTILDVLAALMFPGCRKAVLLLPPTDQYNLLVTYLLLAEHYRVPSLVMHSPQFAEEHYTRPGEPVLHVVPYSMLSQPKNTGKLSELRPDVVIGDEVDTIGDPSSARAKRVLRLFEEQFSTIRGAAMWSGTITSQALEEYAPLALMTLRHGSPLPLDANEVKRWGTAINPVPNQAPAGELLRLCVPGESVHQGFYRRLRDTPGVILTTEAAVDCELIITDREPPPIPPEIRDALRGVRGDWQRPDGEEFVEITEVQACARQLAAGFYYRWVYPRGEPRELIDRWFDARRNYFKAVRWYLKERSAEQLDSPDLLIKAAMRAWGDAPRKPGLPEWKCEYWPAWRDVRDLVKPKTQAVRVHPYLAEDAAQWASNNLGIVWYADNEFGRWVAQISRLPQHVGGPKAPQLIAQEQGNRSIICSIKAHGRGRDGLQRLFEDQLIASPPSNSKGWEQLLGRLVRTGQAAATVRASVYTHTPELRNAVRKALTRAEYVKATTGNRQKLLAGWALDMEDDDE